MLGSALIVFREVFEAALIVAVVLGASRGIAGRSRWIAGGIVLGIAGAVLVAGSAGALVEALQGRGQELFNAAVLLAAVAMLTWHNVWMKAHGRQLVVELRGVGEAVRAGARPLSALALVILLAVLREGSEIVLFLYGIASSGAGWLQVLAGGGLGLAGGIALGWIFYRGLLAIPLGRFFGIVGILLILLASGLAADAAGYLEQAGLLPPLGVALWDSSGLLDQRSWGGMLLHVLVGYLDRPDGIQLLFYLATAGLTLAAMRLVGRDVGVRPAVQPGE